MGYSERVSISRDNGGCNKDGCHCSNLLSAQTRSCIMATAELDITPGHNFSCGVYICLD